MIGTTSEAPAAVSGANPKFQFWKTRVAELFVIQIILLASIAMYVQMTQRLTLTSATIVEGAETMHLPWRNVSVTGENMDYSGLAPSHDVENCIYVPGGGFSGFWLSLGRLQSLENPVNETFVCYSSGCLGVVAALLQHCEFSRNGTAADMGDHQHYHDVYEMARSIQLQWQSGKRHRYRTVEVFINLLLAKLDEDFDETSTTIFLDAIRNKVNILTTAFDDESIGSGYDMVQNSSSGLHSSPQPQLPLPQSILPRAFVRRASDIASLKRLLLQSAWIPLATGSSWTHRGHMDGFFSMAQHPKCSRSVSMISVANTPHTSSQPRDSWLNSTRKLVLLFGNLLNVSLRRDDVAILWRIGIELGV